MKSKKKDKATDWFPREQRMNEKILKAINQSYLLLG